MTHDDRDERPFRGGLLRRSAPWRPGRWALPSRRLYALGVNIDDLETHDTRTVLPRTGFSIEPAIYLPEFGVRLEVNVFIDPVSGSTVTTPIQHEIVQLS